MLPYFMTAGMVTKIMTPLRKRIVTKTTLELMKI